MPRCGRGWAGDVPRGTCVDDDFVRITEQYLDVPLYWQCWKLDSRTVETITAAVRNAAGTLRGSTRF